MPSKPTLLWKFMDCLYQCTRYAVLSKSAALSLKYVRIVYIWTEKCVVWLFKLLQSQNSAIRKAFQLASRQPVPSAKTVLENNNRTDWTDLGVQCPRSSLCHWWRQTGTPGSWTAPRSRSWASCTARRAPSARRRPEMTSRPATARAGRTRTAAPATPCRRGRGRPEHYQRRTRHR